MSPVYIVVSIILAALVLLGIKLMSSPKTAVTGNLLSAFSMLAAVLLVLWQNDILTAPLLWVAMAVGGIIGYVIGMRATMIQMPQMVALLNGLGGGASAIVAMVEIIDGYGLMSVFSKVSSQMALIVGGITLSGSLVAAAKLDRRMSQRPVVLQGHSLITNSIIILTICFAAGTIWWEGTALTFSFLVLFLSLFYGYLFAIRVGGADMPITISLLNSFSGLAGAIVGFAIGEPLLVAVGAIVGASGLILTQIMCRAMNRTLMNVLSGSIGKAAPAGAGKVLPGQPQPSESEGKVAEERKATPGELLREARRVIIVPGYGMAIAQAQNLVKQLADALEDAAAEVKFAIHPVAGRMPGHMNVLLAEVDVPYDKLHEMDDINPEFPDTDVVVIVGANDVVNPAANTAEGTPIYGMPILQVEKAKHVIVCNLDTKPGYAGVDNPLYDMSHVELLLGDAKDSLNQLLQAVTAQGESSVQDEAQAETVSLGSRLRAAKKVIVVPGYGMAIAQAQNVVKQLADALEEAGAEVKFAIHPVAGRMPGHMNVLLAEVDVPYDKLHEMDDINPEFPDTDVVVIVGANDVVNPAANTAEGTPIYGMPILQVEKARHVIVCNLDTKPGYAGVDNPLYDMSHVELLLGDAKDSLDKLIAAVSSTQTAATTGQPVGSEATANSVGDQLAQAKQVIIVPGYGMAIAQAQNLVKQLADALEERGTAVEFAIHPVAGRMPGHMNVLLAEVDVPYDQLREMDDINPKFPDTDVVVIVGANDVVNPAANTAEGTPIYGMPILDVQSAKHVIVCNLDKSPGYAGVDNPLYEMPHVRLLLGDAKDSLRQLLQEISD
ncbi:MAG: NAD(P)(+) transhydrogenase (Re/Si-specific) subunit beta [Bacillota bacterium]|jgi:NAD/NADP transhydrogenase beta subunit